MIVLWGTEFAEDLEVELNFSHGWLEGFLSRHEFVTRIATSKPVLSDEDIVNRAVAFVLHVQALISATKSLLTTCIASTRLHCSLTMKNVGQYHNVVRGMFRYLLSNSDKVIQS